MSFSKPTAPVKQTGQTLGDGVKQALLGSNNQQAQKTRQQALWASMHEDGVH
jgi:hypothetical protein